MKEKSNKKWLVNSLTTHSKVEDWLNETEKEYEILDVFIEYRGAGSWIVFVKVE